MTASLALYQPVSIRIDPYHRLMAFLVASLFTCDLALAHLTGNAGFGPDLVSLLPAFAFFGAIAVYCSWRNLTKCLELTLMLIWAIGVGFGVDALVLAAGHSAAPLADSSLAGMDRMMGFSTPAVVAWIAHFPRWRMGFAIAYNLMPMPVLAALVLPVVFGRTEDTRRFVLAVLAAA